MTNTPTPSPAVDLPILATHRPLLDQLQAVATALGALAEQLYDEPITHENGNRVMTAACELDEAARRLGPIVDIVRAALAVYAERPTLETVQVLREAQQQLYETVPYRTAYRNADPRYGGPVLATLDDYDLIDPTAKFRARDGVIYERVDGRFIPITDPDTDYAVPF